MKQEGVSKENLKVIMKKFGSRDESEDNHFEYNTKVGCVLIANRYFLTTPTEMLLAKCAYCQAMEHDTRECYDICCPLYDYMCEKKRYIKKSIRKIKPFIGGGVFLHPSFSP